MMDFFGFKKNEDKSNNKSNNNSILPPINASRQLTYSNNREIGNVQRQSSQKKKKDGKMSFQSSPMSKLSNSESSSSLSSLGSHENSYNTSESQISQEVAKQQKNVLKSYEHEEYKDKTVSQIAQEIKQMRNKFLQMNKKLSQMLDLYTMAKTQFVPKQLIAPSKSQFYKVQIETNKKVQQAQILELQKLNETIFGVKDKEILFDLQKVLVEMRESLHHSKMQLKEFKVKNHKKGIILDQINKINNDNKDSNAIKLLNLQIFYYMKKQNSLKIHQEQLQHEEKLILQNDKHLNLKIEQLKKSNKNYYLFDQGYQKMRERYQDLKEKKQNLRKQIDILKKAKDINEQKYARQLISMDDEYRNVIKPKTIKCEQKNQELLDKINSLMLTHNLNDKSFKGIRYKFSTQYIGKKSGSMKKISTNILKPNLRPGLNLSNNNDGYSSARVNELESSQSHEKVLATHRYNDKNISMTIDVNLQNNPRFRSFSEALGESDFKPRNFRLMTKKDKRKGLELQKTQPHSMTIDYSYATNFMTAVEGNIAIQGPKMLKPKLLVGAPKR